MRIQACALAMGLVWSFSAFSVDGQEEKKVGEFAYYKLDKSRKRTSAVLKDGEMTYKINSYDKETKTYTFAHTFAFDTRGMGKKSGSGTTPVDADLLSPELLEKVRKDGALETDKYKIKHLGYETVTTQDGQEYADCDIILIYDIQFGSLAKEASPIGKLIERLLANSARMNGPDGDGSPAMIEDAKLKLHVHSSVPVMGAAKIDASGKQNNIPLRAGFDFLKDVTEGELQTTPAP